MLILAPGCLIKTKHGYVQLRSDIDLVHTSINRLGKILSISLFLFQPQSASSGSTAAIFRHFPDYVLNCSRSKIKFFVQTNPIVRDKALIAEWLIAPLRWRNWTQEVGLQILQSVHIFAAIKKNLSCLNCASCHSRAIFPTLCGFCFWSIFECIQNSMSKLMPHVRSKCLGQKAERIEEQSIVISSSCRVFDRAAWKKFCLATGVFWSPAAFSLFKVLFG